MKITIEDEVVIGYDFSRKNIQRYMEKIIGIKEYVYINKNGRDINAKSIIGLLSANLTKGDNVKIAMFGEEENVIENIKLFKEMLGDIDENCG